MATERDFIARGCDVEGVCQSIGADYLMYLDLDRMIQAASVGNPDIQGFCSGCFSGIYPTIDAKEHLVALAAERAQARE